MDEALLRPGRLEVQIEIGLPNEKGRSQILKVIMMMMNDDDDDDNDDDNADCPPDPHPEDEGERQAGQHSAGPPGGARIHDQELLRGRARGEPGSC